MRATGWSAPLRKNIGKITKGITDAKFSRDRMREASSIPRPESASAVSSIAPTNAAAEEVG